jgi:hypothetical protein
MQRRRFLTSLGATLAAHAVLLPKLKIAAVEVARLEGHRETMAGVDRQFQANPLHIYDELRPAPSIIRIIPPSAARPSARSI